MIPLAPQFVPPPIGPVPAGIQRPLWSVMIPTYNCAQYLRQTLESVLAQDPGPDQMQIEVVDDCSTADNPEAVVRAVAGDRVRFYRKEKNGGAIANFNTCIERSRGHLVHILHGDDWVAPGFYSAVQHAYQSHPELSFFHVRSVESDSQGQPEQLSPRTLFLETPGRNAAPLYYSNPLRTPGAVVPRSFYEKHGGFIPCLVHVADWEMWIRAVAEGGGLTLNQPLAFYRIHPGNDTGRLVRSAENLRDYLRLSQCLRNRFPEFNSWTFQRMVLSMAQNQVLVFGRMGLEEAVHANRSFIQEMSPWFRLETRARLLCGALKRACTDP